MLTLRFPTMSNANGITTPVCREVYNNKLVGMTVLTHQQNPCRFAFIQQIDSTERMTFLITAVLVLSIHVLIGPYGLLDNYNLSTIKYHGRKVLYESRKIMARGKWANSFLVHLIKLSKSTALRICVWHTFSSVWLISIRSARSI